MDNVSGKCPGKVWTGKLISFVASTNESPKDRTIMSHTFLKPTHDCTEIPIEELFLLQHVELKCGNAFQCRNDFQL